MQLPGTKQILMSLCLVLLCGCARFPVVSVQDTIGVSLPPGNPDDSLPEQSAEEPGIGLSPEEAVPPEAPALGESYDLITNMEGLGSWTDYNGVVFGDADFYDSQSGGGLAVEGAAAFHANYTVGSTYTGEYDSTLHIGEYQNEEGYPALLLGGSGLAVSESVTSLDVYGGAIAASQDLLDYNNSLAVGLTPRTGSGYQPADKAVLASWFARQYELASAASRLMLLANDESIGLAELGSGSYLEEGPNRFRNQVFQVNGQVYENALFVTVRTGSDVSFGQWWPVHSVVTMDMDWALDYDLLVYNFPDAVNVTMNSSTFDIRNMQHWSTTVDAWIGERGMEERRALAEKVVYNFPNARSVEASQALIQGTILAPDASFTGIGLGDNGHIYGHIIVRNYTARGNFTIHAFHLTRWVYDLVEDAVTNQSKTGALQLRHYLYFDGEPTSIRVSGGEFVLEREDGAYYDGDGGFVREMEQAAAYATLPDQYTLIPEVPLGEYTLVNTVAPEGFFINLSNHGNPHTLSRFPVSIREEGLTVQAVRYSEPEFIDLAFRKADADTGKGIAGAVFTIVRESDEYQDAAIGGTFTSGADGGFTAVRVPAGAYHLLEVEPPPGYGAIEGGEFRFQVVWNAETGSLSVQDWEGRLLTATKEEPLEIPNLPGTSQNAAIVVKYAQDPDEPDIRHPLADAEFSLFRYDEEADAWGETTRDLSGEEIQIRTNQLGWHRITNLPEGRYRLVETKAPPGFALSNELDDDSSGAFPQGYAHEFALSGEVRSHIAYVLGRARELDIEVLSLGSPLGETEPLSGTAFRLEHLLSGGQTWEELVYSAQTGGDGTLLLEALPAGRYRLTQLQAAAGYHTLDPPVVHFTIAFDDNGAGSVQAAYNGLEIGADTLPVSLDSSQGIRLAVHSQAKTSGFLVYKADAAYTSGTGEDGKPTYSVTYLEGARFRLKRRAGTRSPWQDYGPAFASAFLYEEDGAPALDSYGNHIAAAVFPPGLLYGDYQLVETQPPEGYESGSDIKISFSDGETGRQVHLFSITEAMTGNGQISTYNAPNYGLRYTSAFRFRSVESGNYGSAVGGAEFALYQCEEDHVHDLVLMPDSCWAQSTPVIAKSGGDGLVQFEDLISGSYLLRQSHAPFGYRLPGTMWLILMDTEQKAVEVTPTNSASPFLFVQAEDGGGWLLPARKLFALPGTGGTGTAGYLTAGLFLLAAAAALYLLFKRNETRKKS